MFGQGHAEFDVTGSKPEKPFNFLLFCSRKPQTRNGQRQRREIVRRDHATERFLRQNTVKQTQP
ncbi:MAG: Uncharacterised protein [Hyphomonas sp. TMED17]|nr:MAG: Uncharacterised protein [Hyphomonas sp. TMED17]